MGKCGCRVTYTQAAVTYGSYFVCTRVMQGEMGEYACSMMKRAFLTQQSVLTRRGGAFGVAQGVELVRKA